jgi:hypothetical protein
MDWMKKFLGWLFSRENLMALALCLILILLVIVTADYKTAWFLYGDF